MIIFVHMLKAGGTSFRHVLDRLFGDRILLDYDDIPMSNRPEHAEQRARRQADLLKTIGTIDKDIVYGHFVMSKYRGLRPDLRFGTMFREPSERIVSHYFHYLRNIGGARNEILPEGIGLAEFSSLPKYRDMYQYLLGDFSVEELDYVGITEELQASVELFLRVFDCKRPDAMNARSVQHLNRAGEYSSARLHLTETGLEEAVRASQQDNYRIYEAAQARFALLCQKHGVDRFQ